MKKELWAAGVCVEPGRNLVAPQLPKEVSGRRRQRSLVIMGHPRRGSQEDIREGSHDQVQESVQPGLISPNLQLQKKKNIPLGAVLTSPCH